MDRKLLISILVIGGIIIISWMFAMNTTKHVAPVQSNAMKIYGEANKSFTITAPADWTAQENIGTQKTGIGTNHAVTSKIALVNLASSTNAGINIQVYEGTPSCDTVQKPNSNIAGMPAFYDALHKTWTIDTVDATYVLSYYYPGRGTYHARYGVPTPAPQAVQNMYERLFTGILNSFKPTNPQLVSC